MNKDVPLVSVILPCYNGEEYIGEAIDSVKSQTYNNWELIIVDDASKDESMKILRYQASICTNIRVVEHKRNKGIASARNSGIERAEGKFVAFLDQDDIWRENKLKKSIRFAKSLKNPGLIHTGLTIINPKTDTCRRIEKKRYSKISDDKLMVDLFLEKKPFYGASNVMVNYKCFEDLGMMDERLSRWDDKEMWLRILSDATYETYCIEEPLIIKRKWEGQASGDKEVVRDQMRLHNIALQKHPPLKKYADTHVAKVYFRYAKHFWSEGFSRKYLYNTVGNFAKSAYMNPKRWETYVFLILSLGGKYTRSALKKVDEYLP